MYRFDKDGTADPTFGESGTVTVDLGVYTNTCCIAIDSAKRIVVAGILNSTSDSAFVVRFNENGELDTGFGNMGMQTLVLDGNSYIYSLAIDSKGRPIVAGSSEYGVATLVQLNLDGSLNKAVGYDGVFTTPIGFSSSYATSVAIDGLGRPSMTIIGFPVGGGSTVSAAVRYDELFGEGFD